MSNSSLEHYKYLDYIFSYLVNTRSLELDLTLESKQSANNNNTSKSLKLVEVSNTDQRGNLDSRKSTIGNIFLLENINNKKSIAIS